MAETISLVELKSMMAGGGPHAVVDVREPMEFNQEQIHRSTNLPRGWLEFRIAVLVPVKDTPLAIVDGGRGRAARCAETLEAHGYTGATLLAGGLPAWKAAGLPTVSGTNVPSKEFGERVLHEDGIPEIEAEELHALIESDDSHRIFDSRTVAEYERFAIPTGVSLPGGELILHAWDLDQDKTTPLIINCAGRTRSIIGAGGLHRLGIKNARALRNGGMGFILAGLPLTYGERSEIPRPSDRSRAHGEVLAARLAEEEGIPSVSPEELLGLQEKSGNETLYLLDVRLAPEFGRGHIPGAISIPGGQAVQRTDEVAAVRAAAFVTYCDANARATMTAYWLRRIGLERVFYLKGGLAAWEAAGLSVYASGLSADRESPSVGGEPLGLAAARAAVRAFSPEEALKLAEEGTEILDVDLSLSFRAGHVSGSRWVSRAWLEERAPSMCPDRSRPVVLICEDGARSALSAATLAGMDYTGAAFVEGGKEAWREDSLPLEEGDEGFEGPVLDVALKPYDIGPSAMQDYLDWEEKLGK
ncbi:MAG: rhodanese-like domain-containing protein [Nitrospinota bacterium]|nr:rhodanese-like domain-containing protein [Nitrospinota bacterium]